MKIIVLHESDLLHGNVCLFLLFCPLHLRGNIYKINMRNLNWKIYHEKFYRCVTLRRHDVFSCGLSFHHIHQPLHFYRNDPSRLSPHYKKRDKWIKKTHIYWQLMEEENSTKKRKRTSLCEFRANKTFYRHSSYYTKCNTLTFWFDWFLIRNFTLKQFHYEIRVHLHLQITETLN